jgi:hypothetical protein
MSVWACHCREIIMEGYLALEVGAANFACEIVTGHKISLGRRDFVPAADF